VCCARMEILRSVGQFILGLVIAGSLAQLIFKDYCYNRLGLCYVLCKYSWLIGMDGEINDFFKKNLEPLLLSLHSFRCFSRCLQSNTNGGFKC